MTLELSVVAFGGIGAVAGAAGGVGLDDEQRAEYAGDFGGDGIGAGTGHGVDYFKGTLHHAAVAGAAVGEEIEDGAGIRVLCGTLAPAVGVDVGKAQDSGGDEGEKVGTTAVEVRGV